MRWSLLELRKFQEEPLTFSETIDLKNSLISRDPSILDIALVSIDGLITVSKGEYIVHYTVKTTITVPSTRSLTPVTLPLSFTVDEVFMTPEQYEQRSELIVEEDILLLETDIIDLQESVEDNIILALPTQVLTDEERQSKELPKGDGWEVVSEEEFNERTATEKTMDPRLAKLSELLQENPEDESDNR